MKELFRLRLSTSLLAVLICLLIPAAAAASFGEAPMLEEKVAAGDLPAVADRLPDHDSIYVVEVEEIGRYGGTLRTAGWHEDTVAVSSPNILRALADGSGFVPHFAKDVTYSEDMTEWTIQFREGVRWSDGEPFTTEDSMFWYNHILLNEELTPVVGGDWRSAGEVMEMQALDNYTLQINFVRPKPFFENTLFMATNSGNMVTPKHYLQKFHPDFVDMDELEALVEEEGFAHWYELFGHKWDRHYGLPLNPDLPTVTAYVMTELRSTHRAFERNPYYWKTDQEGNQLPYIDRIYNEFVEAEEIFDAKIISGEVDFAGFDTDLGNFPMYRSFEEEGNYRTILWDFGNVATIFQFNQTHEDPALREIFQDVRFRRAMSLGMDREEVNEIQAFGRGRPMQYTVFDSSAYYKPEFEKAYVEFDPERANAKLDEMGLDERDREGYRLRQDGERLTFTIETFPVEVIRMEHIELISEMWRENLGIDVRVRQISGELAGERAPANLMDATTWTGGEVLDTLFPMYAHWFTPMSPGWSRTSGVQWARWFQTDGEQGEEPPDHVKELRSWYDDVQSEPDPERRVELGQKILAYQAENLWSIGTVGYVPKPIIFSKNLRNIPEEGIWAWATLWTISRDPEQWFFAE